jgi:hypothetical protein
MLKQFPRLLFFHSCTSLSLSLFSLSASQVNCCWSSSAQSFFVSNSAGLDHILLSHVSGSRATPSPLSRPFYLPIVILPRILSTASYDLTDCEMNWPSFGCRCFRCPIVDTNEYLMFQKFFIVAFGFIGNLCRPAFAELQHLYLTYYIYMMHIVKCRVVRLTKIMNSS